MAAADRRRIVPLYRDKFGHWHKPEFIISAATGGAFWSVGGLHGTIKTLCQEGADKILTALRTATASRRRGRQLRPNLASAEKHNVTPVQSGLVDAQNRFGNAFLCCETLSRISTQALPTSMHALGDKFLTGLSVMLVVNVLQRVVGLLRNLGFCRFLSDAELGQWALANSFFILAAPLAVLGLPGSFGKFVEIYRRQGKLGAYLRSLSIVSGGGLIALSLAMCFAPQHFAWLVFNDVAAAKEMAWLISTLAAVTVFNFVNELVSALRQVRVVSAMQFINSAAFAVIGMIGLLWTQSWGILLPSYTLACLLGLVPGLWVLRHAHADELRSSGPIPGMWARIVPFAIALWFMNLLSNMFDVCDRALLLHLTQGDAAMGQAIIGQYHCGRIIPNLLISVGTLLSGVLLPYLSSDFESSDTDQLRKRLQQVLQLVSVMFTGAAIAALLASPLLFDVTLAGRYDEARSVLPLALLQSIWMSLFLLAQTVMFCLERGKQVAVILAFGLVLNIALNYPMIMSFGLAGSVAATAAANGVVLALLLWRIGREGYPLGWRTALICFVPVVLVCGTSLS